eukprot:3220473-Pyramimonas_sp.AAC.1
MNTRMPDASSRYPEHRTCVQSRASHSKALEFECCVWAGRGRPHTLLYIQIAFRRSYAAVGRCEEDGIRILPRRKRNSEGRPHVKRGKKHM